MVFNLKLVRDSIRVPPHKAPQEQTKESLRELLLHQARGKYAGKVIPQLGLIVTVHSMRL